MNSPRLLLLTSTPPGDGSVGEIFLRDLCRIYPHDRLACYAITSPGITVAREWKPSEELAWLPTEIEEWWGYHRGGGMLRAAAKKVGANALFERTRLSGGGALLDRVERHAREHRIEKIWCVLGSPVMYLLAAPLADRLGVPLVTTVWDPFERIARDFDLAGPSRRAALASFGEAVRRSERVGVMSESMRDEYERLYGAHGVIMRHGVDAAAHTGDATAAPASSTLTLGYGGSLYALEEWGALMRALEGIDWTLDGRAVSVRVYGSNARVNTPDGARVELMGWRPMAEVIDGLSRVEANYLPYWFDPAHRPDVRLCFPTKLTSYLASGRPIFYHGPADSSPVAFFERFPAAVCCHSLETDAIVSALRELVGNTERYRTMIEAGRAAIEQELNESVFHERFRELVTAPGAGERGRAGRAGA
jgi:glycosyltransferase involved in cell wall biosynthesis